MQKGLITHVTYTKAQYYIISLKKMDYRKQRLKQAGVVWKKRVKHLKKHLPVLQRNDLNHFKIILRIFSNFWISQFYKQV